MRKVLTFVLAAAVLASASGCKEQDGHVRSKAFKTELTGGQVQWVYWPGKKGSVALWLVPVESQEPILTLTCAMGDRKLNLRGYSFSNYPGTNGQVMFMTMEARGVGLRSRVSWAPTGDTPIAQADMRVKSSDLAALASAPKLTFSVEGERYVFDGFGAAGNSFPAACAQALGLS